MSSVAFGGMDERESTITFWGDNVVIFIPTGILERI
jgi:hypothetical protein